MEVVEDVLAYWNDPATVQRYDSQAGHGIRNPAERDAWLETLRDLLPGIPSDVVDLGTGTGFLAILAARLGHRVTGLDLAENMLARAREKAAEASLPVSFREGDAVAPPLDEAVVDVVMNRHLMWTLPEPRAAVENWARALRPNGRIVVIDAPWFAGQPAAPVDAPKDPWRAHYRPEVVARLPLMAAADASPIVGLLTSAGLRDVRVERLPRVEVLESSLAGPGDEHTTPSRYAILGFK